MMKVLTLWEPWAMALVLGIKKIETRSWNTNYRGELLIHAAVKPCSDIIKLIGAETAIQLTKYLREKSDYQNFLELPYGAIVGKVNLVDCKQQMLIMDKWPEITMSEIDWGDYSDNRRYAWRMHNSVAFKEPIPAKGSQGLWNWDGYINELHK